MCGRYRRKSDKQRIANTFGVSEGAENLDLGADDDIAPGSMQPVVSINADGQRQPELMRWGFKLPDRLLFNARSEGIEVSKFWKDAFLKGRVIVSYGRDLRMEGDAGGTEENRNTNLAYAARNPLAWPVSGSSGEPEDERVGVHLRCHYRRTK